ncbi:MAG TPA: hypothetical protein VFS39_08535 [Nitrospira sp.]|nr:hypothetical protein [Nitrospira sp.]
MMLFRWPLLLWLGVLWFPPSEAAPAAEIPLFDAHIHYNHDVWDALSPKEAVAILREAGVRCALVSSSGDEGTRRLYAEAPDLVVPELRPYRKTGETRSWLHDDSVIGYLQARLDTQAYVAIGEFHVNGTDADLPVVRRLVQLAKRQRLMLHAHSDAEAIERLFRQDREATIIWAHAGYESPALVREMVRRYRNLWPELSSRTDVAPTGRLAPAWRDVLVEFPDRFMIGTDTHQPERWKAVSSNAAFVRRWLEDLPDEIAERIAYKNGEALISSSCPKGSPKTTTIPAR